MLKRIILLFIILLASQGCSRVLDEMFTEEMSEFNINVYSGPANGQITVVTNRNDHIGSPSTLSAGTFFRGYYIYRNTGGPYDDFGLHAIESYPYYVGTTFNNFFYVFDGDSVTPPPGGQIDSVQGTFTDSCTANTIYYYRVVVMYQKFDGSNWGSYKEEGKSSWMAAWCPKDLFGGF